MGRNSGIQEEEDEEAITILKKRPVSRDSFEAKTTWGRYGFYASYAGFVVLCVVLCCVLCSGFYFIFLFFLLCFLFFFILFRRQIVLHSRFVSPLLETKHTHTHTHTHIHTYTYTHKMN